LKESKKVKVYNQLSPTSFDIYVEQMNMAYALYKGFWEATEKAFVLEMN